jgi:hypothetical protein
MTKFQGGPLTVAPGQSQAYRDNYDRIFGGKSKKLCTCPKEGAASCDPCYCCKAESGEACRHPEEAPGGES